MIKRTLILLTLTFFFLVNASAVSAADKQPGDSCTPNVDICKPDPQGRSYSCLPAKSPPPDFLCQVDVFGKIQAPDALAGFLKKNPTGASAISQFLSNGITLLYSVAAIVLIFMILWGAFDWMISGGDKEKVASAQKRIINAVIGILLFAAAFAIIRVLGTFTGFKFFAGQGIAIHRDETGKITQITCPKGTIIWFPGNDIEAECKNK